MANMRNNGTIRDQHGRHVRGVAISNDSGHSFGHISPRGQLTEPSNGCQASILTDLATTLKLDSNSNFSHRNGDSSPNSYSNANPGFQAHRKITNEPGFQPHLETDTDPPMLFFTNPNASKALAPFERSHLTLKRSTDGGYSWPLHLQTLIYGGVSGYSCLTQMIGRRQNPLEQINNTLEDNTPGDRLGLLWETDMWGTELSDMCIGSRCRIVFSVVSMQP